jgi:hypothetical protein
MPAVGAIYAAAGGVHKCMPHSQGRKAVNFHRKTSPSFQRARIAPPALLHRGASVFREAAT